jgi:DNA polymerase I-like protein with 3'-5' exonuclease and polymerase domains
MEMMSAGICPPDPKDYHLPTHFPSLAKAAYIAADLETHDPNVADKGPGCHRNDGYIVGGAIAAWDKDGVLMHHEYYPIGHRVGPNCDKEKVLSYFRDNLNFFEGELIGANVVQYDGDWFQAYDIRPRFAKWRDVQWAEALIDEMAISYKLENLSQKYLGYGKVTDRLKELYGGTNYIKRFREVHPGYAREYGLGDVLNPYLIWQEQKKELARLGMEKLFDTECRLAPFLLYLREQGVRISRERAESFNIRLEESRAAKLTECTKLSGVYFDLENFGKNSTIVRALDALGIEYPKTKQGNPSIKNKWLERLEHPFGAALAAANKYDKAKETFVDGYILDYAVGDRVHGEFHPLRRADEEGERGTVSGRFSGNHPNLQNIPARDEEIGPLCRSMFVPEEGAKWWALDYSQIEYRMLVHFAVARKCKGAELAQAMYLKDPNTDFHQAVAELTGLKRKDAKNLNFGLVYGMGVPKLADSLGLLDEDGKPKKEALDIMEMYHGKAPFIKDLYNKCGKDASEDGEVRTLLNRRSQFELYEPRYTPKDKDGKMQHMASLPYAQALEAYGFDIKRSHTHKALNRLLQGSAADVMKFAMVMMWEAGVFSSTKDFTCSLTVHDELDGSIYPTKRGEECYKEAINIMQTCLPLNVPVLVGAGIGADWSEAK